MDERALAQDSSVGVGDEEEEEEEEGEEEEIHRKIEIDQ